MRQFVRNSRLIRIPLGLAVVLLFCAAAPMAHAQQPPLVYNVENTGASFPAPTLPDFAHAPLVRQLPDPFVFFNGSRDTSWSAFEQHRNEWFYSLEQNEIGTKPDCHDCTVTASFAYTSGSTTAGVLTINIVRNGKTLSFTAAIVQPTPSANVQPAGRGWPYVIGMGSATGSWPGSAFNASTTSPTGVTVKPAGCAATVVYSLNSIAKYSPSGGVHVTDPFYTLYPEYCAGTCSASNGYPNGSNHGEYAAWSWGISRLIDGIQLAAQSTSTPLPLDTTHSAVTGCSYAGKMAMWGGALDERVALSIAQENGGGGAPSWRISHEIETQGSVENINDTNYEWFQAGMHQYNGANVYKMPTDHHELMAMMAPRAMLQTGDSLYYWLGDRSATFDSLATEKIYANYGIGDRFGYYIDTAHNHCVVPAYQQNATQPFINRFLFGANVDSTLAVSEQFAGNLQPGAQPTWDPAMWTAWWGTGTPAFPAADVWNSGGDVMLPLNQNLTVNTGDTMSTSFALTMPGTHAAATVTVPTAFTETDIACTDGTSYTLVVPPVNSSGYQTNSQVFTLAANDNSTQPSNVYTAANPGCTNGLSGKSTANYFFALGLTSPGAGNPGLTGFSTTNGQQSSGQTDPLNVTFNLANSTTNLGGNAPTTTLNRQNPYSCTPPGCPLTPTLTWTPPTTALQGVPLDATQLNASASSLLLSGLTTTGSSGLLVAAPVPGSWTYSPAPGTVLSPGINTLTATFTPASIITPTTTAGNAYKTYTIATASAQIFVGTVSVTSTGALSKTASGYQMVVTVANSGNATATNVQLTGAALGATSGATLPASLGDIVAGSSASVTLTFPSSTGSDGAGIRETLSGTYNGGTFGGSFRAVLP